MKKISFTVLLIAMGFSGLHAQDGPAILSAMPANRHVQFSESMKAMGALDENRLAAVAESLKPYGSEDNTSLQFALHGFAGYVMKPGREAWRKTAVQAYGKALGKETDRMNRQFLIRQLQLMGGDDAVPFLQPCLADSFLVGQAARALATIATPKANRALREALESAAPANRVPLVEALGDSRDARAVKMITPLAKSSDPDLKKAALYALANTADPSSAKVLLKAAQAGGYHFENENATADCMLYINRLIESSRLKAAKKMVKKLKKKIAAKDHPGVYQAVRQFQNRLEGPKAARKPNTLSRAEKSSGFIPLFNGKNLDGWTGNKAGYRVENGAVVVHPEHGNGGNLYTEKEFGNFVLRFQFKLTPGANNGIGIRTPLTGDAAYVGMEIQVLDNTADKYKDLHPYQYHGSVYGVIPAKRGYLKPVGRWNEEEIRADGTKIRVTLNGHVIVDGDIASSIANGTMDHKSHPGLKNKNGHIGFLGHGSVVYFRDIRIKTLE